MEHFDWVIVGAGAAGLTSTLALLGSLPGLDPLPGSILLIDQGEAGQGSSVHNPGRAHGGFHYPDFETAAHLQDLLVHNLVTYPNRFTGHIERDSSQRIRTSWYGVLPDLASDGDGPKSILPNQESLRLFEGLADRWERLKRDNPQLEVLGDDRFYHWVDGDVATDLLGTDMYFRVARTLEPFLNVKTFVDDLIHEVREDARVTIREQDELLELNRNDGGSGFLLQTRVGSDQIPISAKCVNICSWEATEALLAHLGYKFNTLNRIKRGFRLRLGRSSYDFPSIMAVYGSHAEIRNLGDGRGFATVGDLTNLNTTRLKDPSQSLHNYIAHSNDAEAHHAMHQAHEALKLYYPNVDIEEVDGVEHGVVKMFSDLGKITLNDITSDQHRRAVEGFSACLEPGLFVTWSMKLVSCFIAAEKFRENCSKNSEATT